MDNPGPRIQRGNDLTRGQVPDDDRVVRSGRQPPPIGRECQALEVTLPTCLQGGSLSSGPRVIELHLLGQADCQRQAVRRIGDRAAVLRPVAQSRPTDVCPRRHRSTRPRINATCRLDRDWPRIVPPPLFYRPAKKRPIRCRENRRVGRTRQRPARRHDDRRCGRVRTRRGNADPAPPQHPGKRE